MSEEFDPYRKWLGIPKSEQPPSHYRLLAIGELEDDPDVISNAADRCMAHVRTFQSGPYAAYSQQILNELAAARLCLLTPDQKAAYDKQLRAAKKKAPVRVREASPAAAPTAVPVAQPIAQPGPVAEAIPVAPQALPAQGASPQPVGPQAVAASTADPIPLVTGAATKKSSATVARKPRKKSSPVPILIGVAVVIGGIVVGVFATRPKAPSAAAPNAAPASGAQTVSSTASDPFAPNGSAPAQTIPDWNETAPSGSPSLSDDEGPGRVEKRLDHIRSLMKNGRREIARGKLEELAQREPPPEFADHLANLRQIFEYLDEIDERLARAWERFQPGSSLSLSLEDGSLDSTARVVEKDDFSMRVAHIGQELTLTPERVPARWAVALMRPELEAEPARLLLLEIVCEMYFREGDSNRAKAIYAAAQREGAGDRALAAELGLPVDEQAAGKPEMQAADKGRGDAPDSEQPTSAAPAIRAPLPSESDLRAAREKVDQQFAARIRDAATDEEQTALASMLIGSADQAQDDPAQRLALLEAHAKLKIARGDAIGMVGAVDRIAEAFEIDALEWKTRYLSALAVGNRDLEQNETIFSIASNLILAAKASGQNDRIAPLALLAREAALRSNNWRAVRDMQKIVVESGAE
ncbi:MAG: hypothetical protein KDA42_06960 [Planctomycetales bacterium]|nr:hypothetical protein [Planctomycetales bacterium]